jgi:hypothetical protein
MSEKIANHARKVKQTGDDLMTAAIHAPDKKRYTLPPFLVEHEITEKVYLGWLKRKARTHVKRDRKRGLNDVTEAKYRDAIHAAILKSDGKDAYTGELLDWSLISQYDNDASKAGRHTYKASFAMLPTVDHIDASSRSASFVICAWRTNDAKNDLTTLAFVALCEKVLLHAGYTVTPPIQMTVDTVSS